MKPPNDLWDKNLLEEEPFLSQFMIRNGLTQNRRGDNWIATLAKEVHDNESSRAAAVQWSSQYAFAPEGKTQTKNIDHASLGSVEIFVRFYWALYSDKEQAALDVVNRERRKRGFSFQFELSRRPQNSGCIRAGRASTQIQKEQEIASYEHSSQTSLSRGSRGKRAPRKPTTSVGRDAAGRTASGKSRKAADATSTDGGTMVTGATGRDKSSAQSGGSAQTAEFSSSGSLTHTPDADARDPWAAMTFPEEDKGVVVFRGDHDAVAFEVAHSQPQNDPPPCMTVAHDQQASGDRTDSASSSPTVVCPSTPSDVSGTTAAEPPVGFGKGRGRRARRDGPTEPTRQRPPRAATNHGKLSQLAKDEFKYYSKAKRGLVDDLEDLAVPANGAQQSASAPPTRRAKRSRVRTASEDRDDPMLPPADHGEAERMSGPTSASIAVHPAAPEAARRIPRSKYARPKPRRGEKGNEKERERNIRGADSSYPRASHRTLNIGGRSLSPRIPMSVCLMMVIEEPLQRHLPLCLQGASLIRPLWLPRLAGTPPPPSMAFRTLPEYLQAPGRS
ncbi:hypothetical protein BD310DRAFT_174418 [Dichomitus squalens]|uniref:Uncharacterized protein n=1 Tax=Dichomitus squalens TaxID=114155 RepID=A0A4Q9Q2Y3_9APHY|nr:hypothetical protein BD310DRAFT_174418 [Dichomitus squalens]